MCLKNSVSTTREICVKCNQSRPVLRYLVLDIYSTLTAQPIQRQCQRYVINTLCVLIQIKAMQGIKMSYRLQEVLQTDPSEPIRGIRTEDDNIISLNSFIYSLIRNNRGQRRAMLQSLLNMFDETGVRIIAARRAGFMGRACVYIVLINKVSLVVVDVFL